jgi:beta-lactamase class A
MTLNRRAFLILATASMASPALAEYDSIKKYEDRSGGRIGFYAKNLSTGAKTSWRADERFVMCSTFKASLAALVLTNVDQGRESLDAHVNIGTNDLEEYAPIARKYLAKGFMSVGQMCAGAVEYSDNTCANVLLARVGGPEAMTKYWRSIGDDASRLDHNEPMLNRTPIGEVEDTTTPAAMAETISKISFGSVLSDASRSQFRNWMVSNTTGANRLRAGLPAAWKIGDKTGNNGKDGFGDLTITWTKGNSSIVVAAYTRGGAPTSPEVDAVFAAIGNLVTQKLG